jgi:two-component system response regulator AtoC
MARRANVLIVDDDEEYLSLLRQALSRDFEVSVARNAEEASRRLNFTVDAMLLDLRLEGGGTEDRAAIRLMDAVRELRPIPIIIMTAYGEVEVAVEAMKLGAADFIQKSRVNVDDLRKILFHVIERSRAERRAAELEEEVHRLEPWELIGDSPRLNEVRRLIDAVAVDGRATVLVRGETGTGKELVARAVHTRGARKEGPFVAVALPALAPTLIERELFGHLKGAFTDAREGRHGYIQKAAGGVLFLDEIGDLALDLQPKLLRFLDGCAFAPVGGSVETSIDVQVVCATNRNLAEAVRAGQFREDLYYRLRTMEILVPSLRERLDDVPLLVDHFLFTFRRQGRTHAAGITTAALGRLKRYGFPGNVRELRAIVERAVMMAGVHEHAMIDVDDLPAEITSSAPLIRQPAEGEQIDLDAELARAELACIERALQITEGRKSDAWRLLGLNDRFALLRRVKRIRDLHPDLINDYPILRTCYVEPAERPA